MQEAPMKKQPIYIPKSMEARKAEALERVDKKLDVIIELLRGDNVRQNCQTPPQAGEANTEVAPRKRGRPPKQKHTED